MKERTPNSPRIIYVAGGYLSHSLDTFEGFNVDDGTWTTLAKLTIPRSGLGVAFLKVTKCLCIYLLHWFYNISIM